VADASSRVGEQGDTGTPISSALGSVLRSTLGEAPNLGELATVVSGDPGFSIAVLKVVNSPMYGRREPVSSVRKAVAILGIEALRNLALCVAASSGRSARELYPFDLDRFWEESVRRAAAAEVLASAEAFSSIDETEAFTLGLVVDLPVVQLIARRLGRAEAWMNAAGSTPARRREVEKQLFGRAHDELAAELTEQWGVPPRIAAVMTYHHDPVQAPNHHVLACRLCNLAEDLAAVYSADDTAAAWKRIRKRLLDELGLDREAADQLVERVGPRVERAARVLGIRVPQQPDIAALDRRARNGIEMSSFSRRDLVRLVHRLTGCNEALERKLQWMQRELEAARGVDELTGLANGSALSRRTVLEVRRIARSGTGLAILALCIDGDAPEPDVERTVAVGLGNTMRGTDLIARRAPGRFEIMLPDGTLAGAIVAARRAAEGVAREFELTGSPSVDLHFGVCCLENKPEGAVDHETVAGHLLKRAARHAEEAAGRGVPLVRTGDEVLPWGERDATEEAA
jgi:two-component system cell cycle response regulator